MLTRSMIGIAHCYSHCCKPVAIHSQENTQSCETYTWRESRTSVIYLKTTLEVQGLRVVCQGGSLLVVAMRALQGA